MLDSGMLRGLRVEGPKRGLWLLHRAATPPTGEEEAGSVALGPAGHWRCDLSAGLRIRSQASGPRPRVAPHFALTPWAWLPAREWLPAPCGLPAP